ncbi:hypothetical protein Tco_0291631 [Tanacetum coccineum]
MPPKRTSTSEAPAMTQAAIKKLVANSVVVALEAQAATMANSLGTGLLPSGRDPTDEDGDIGMGDSTGVLVSLGGGISSGGKKSQESNIGDSDNTRDGGKTAGGGIVTYGGLMALYACMTVIYGSSCKVKKTSVAKRYLVKSFEESGEVFPCVAGK